MTNVTPPARGSAGPLARRAQTDPASRETRRRRAPAEALLLPLRLARDEEGETRIQPWRHDATPRRSVCSSAARG